MARRVKAARLALVALVMWLPACRLGSEGGPGSPAARSPASPAVHVITARITRKGIDPSYRVEVGYPRIVYPGRRSIETAVNTAVRSAVEAVVAAFVEGLEPAPGGDGTGRDEAPPSSLEGGHETVLLDAATASFRLTFSRYFSGAAHPSGEVLGLTFDLATGKRYLLEDLFRPEAPYLERLSAECHNKLTEELGADADAPSIEEGTAPKARSFAAWALSDTALEITFAEYQVGAYALGMPRCSIDRRSLRDLASESGPLASR